MDLQKRHEGPYVVLTVSNDRIDAANAVHLKDAFSNAIAAEKGLIIMDLEAVSFMDSSGLGAMVASMKLLEDGRKLALCGLSPAVEKVFKLTRMFSVFDIHTDLASAVERATHDANGMNAA